MILKSRTCLHIKFFKRLYSKTDNKDVEIIKSSILKDMMNEEDDNLELKPKKWSLYESKPKSINQSFTNIFLFPGQGTQFVQMGKSLKSVPKAMELFDSASEYLKYDLLDVCLNGPKEKLDQTVFCQPAIYVSSLAVLEQIKAEQPELIENCIATAGNSLGEITSLVFAGVLSFEAGLHFVKVRAESMDRACQEARGGLLTVFLGPKCEIQKAMTAAKQYCYEKLRIEKPVCEISTYLFSECKVIGGHVEALDFLQTFAKDFKLKGATRLNVSGAFHTSMMGSAIPACREALEEIGTLYEPQINVLSNVTGTVHTRPGAIKRLLVEQICTPVLWEQILMRLYIRPATIEHPTTVEIGPGSQLGKTVKRVNESAFKKYRNFKV